MHENENLRALTESVGRYFDLMYDCDVSRFDRVFRNTANLHGFRNGAMTVWPADVYRDLLAKRTSPKSLGALRGTTALCHGDHHRRLLDRLVHGHRVDPGHAQAYSIDSATHDVRLRLEELELRYRTAIHKYFRDKPRIEPQTMTVQQAREFYETVVTLNPDPVIRNHLSKTFDSWRRVTMLHSTRVMTEQTTIPMHSMPARRRAGFTSSPTRAPNEIPRPEITTRFTTTVSAEIGILRISS